MSKLGPGTRIRACVALAFGEGRRAAFGRSQEQCRQKLVLDAMRCGSTSTGALAPLPGPPVRWRSALRHCRSLRHKRTHGLRHSRNHDVVLRGALNIGRLCSSRCRASFFSRCCVLHLPSSKLAACIPCRPREHREHRCEPQAWRRSSESKHRHLTPPSSGRPPASFACFRPPLMSNVRPQYEFRLA